MNVPGIYRAKCLRLQDPGLVVAAIPQVFGTADVTISQFTGDRPDSGESGWVLFEGADSDYPVWLSKPGVVIAEPPPN